DADGDGIPDQDDALLFSTASSTWPKYIPKANEDGNPDPLTSGTLLRLYNFTGPNAPQAEYFTNDTGTPISMEQCHGWKRDISKNHRIRGRVNEAWRDSFLFTRSHDVWEVFLGNGTYRVTVCIGDSEHEQTGQNVALEGKPVFESVSTAAGMFAEATMEVTVADGRLTMDIGKVDSTTNTCVNWIRIVRP
ncbi:MAG: hypothetical protein L3K26_20220, partial [Candidatus Hydrogenedentes bacterium]|nr:hypothetical protein [Candidatus Hydrogenedentota bacterium]